MKGDAPTEYRLWGRVEHSRANEFLVIVTAVPENGDRSLVKVLTEEHTSRENAREARRRLLKQMGRIVLDNEGRVTDIETDGF